MKIKSIKIHNWRSIKDIDIDFENLMVFIGQNNHGKSNILSSILFFFGQITHSSLDFNNGSSELFVEITFYDLDSHDLSQFQKYVNTEGEIKVRKLAIKDGSFEYHGYCEIPTDNWLNSEQIISLKREEYEKTPLKTLLPPGRLTKEILLETQKTYIQQHKEEIDFTYRLETSNFLGLKSVAQGIFGEIFYIPAVRSAAEELQAKGNSTFNKLLSNVINKMSEDNEKYKQTKEQVLALITSLNKRMPDGQENTERPKELTELEKRLGEELKSWNTTIDVEVTPPDINDVFRVGTSVMVNDGERTDISRKGNGLQRSLIFALIKSWVYILKENAKSNEEKNEDFSRKASTSTYFIFEEPELYLHPQAQKQLYDSLKDLSEVENQVILTTHSSYFIDLKRYKSICIVYKNSIGEGTKKLQCKEELFDSEDKKKKFDISYWINPDRGELFFAKKVILIEGPCEKALISYLAKNLGVFKFEYSLIECGGKDSMPTYITLLNKFHLKYTVVYDLDHQKYKSEQAVNTANIKTKLVEDIIDNSLGTSIVLENDIEEEVGLMDEEKKHKPLSLLELVEDKDFKITEKFQEKIKKIYL